VDSFIAPSYEAHRDINDSVNQNNVNVAQLLFISTERVLVRNSCVIFKQLGIALLSVRRLPMGAIRCPAGRILIQCEDNKARTHTG
jgi:hypothetical protein